MTQTDRLRQIARQYCQTDQLLGVHFVPVRVQLPAQVQDSAVEVNAIHPIVHDGVGPQSTSQRPTMVEMKSSPRISGENNVQDNLAALNELRQRHDASCPHCTTVTTHTQTVFGEGNPCAELMFIGEAPGEEEDRTGRPFVGRAGEKLNEIIKAMKLSREDVYIANILKSRPPDNRTPLEHEVQACAPFLAEQIRIIHPKVIVALGNPAVKFLLQTEIGITRMRGQWNWYQDGDLRIPVMPTFHPAYLLRNYTVDTRQKMWSDMQAVVGKLKETAVT